jgi:hypothetical protein
VNLKSIILTNSWQFLHDRCNFSTLSNYSAFQFVLLLDSVSTTLSTFKMKIILLLIACVLYVNAGVLLKTKYHGALNRQQDLLMKNKQENEEWFQQRVNHFDPLDTRTFGQRYFVNSTYFNGNGPIFGK